MIIHSPVISGSLTFADGATFTLPDNGVYSGSFSGSIQTAGDLLTIDNGTFASFSSSVSSSIGGISTDFADFSGNVTASAVSASGVINGSQIVADQAHIDGITFNVGTNNMVSIGSGSGVNPFGLPDQGLYINSTGGNTSGFVTFANAGIAKASVYSYDGSFIIQPATGEDTIIYADGGNGGLVLDADGTASLDYHLLPTTNVAQDLGSPTLRWRDLYLSGNTFNLGGSKISSTPSGGLNFKNADDTPAQIVAAQLVVSSSAGQVTLEVDSDSGGLATTNVSGITGSSANINPTDGTIPYRSGSDFGDSTISVSGSNTIVSGDLKVGAEKLQINNVAVTSTAAELNLLDTATAGTITNSKAVVYGSAGEVNATKLQVGGVDITSTPSELNSVGNLIASQSAQDTAISLSGTDVTILGDLTVQGDTTTLNTATLSVEDLNITMASGAGSAAAANGAGITVAGASATLTYASTGDKWVFNKVVDVPTSGILINGTAVTSTAAELNLLDTAVAGTIVNEKAVIYGAAGEVNATTLQIGGTSITATATELNQLDDNTVGGTTAGDIVTIDATQTLTNKTIAASQVTEISNLTADEGAQLENIGSTTISAAQWGYLGGLTATDTELNQLDDVTVGGTTAGDIVTIDGTQTLSNKTIAASQVTEISNLTAAEGAQLENIGATTISATQWGYLGEMNQSVTNTSNVTFGNINGGTGTFTGDVIAYSSSDEKLKDNIELISNPIAKIKSLKGVTWTWNDNADELQKSLPNVGVIAQDVERVLPQLVTDRDNGFKAVDYAKLTGLLIEAIKEQQKEIETLKSRLI